MTQINYLHFTVFLVIFIITYILIIHKSFDKTLAALLGAWSILIIGGLLNILDQESFLAEELGHDYLILAILFGNLLMVAIASEIGLFQFISIKLLKATKGDPNKIYWALGSLTFLFSAIIGTIPAILIIGALTVVACSELKFEARSYILMEIVITNTAGLTTSISAITNLVIAIPFGISFLQFFLIAFPLSLTLFFVSMKLMKKLCPIPVSNNDEWRIKKILEFDEWIFVKNRNQFYGTSIIFVLTLIFLLLSDVFQIEIAVIVVGGGILMAWTSGKELELILSKIDWSLLAFFTSLFVLIKGLEIVGVMDLLTEWLLIVIGDNSIVGAIVVLIFSALLSGVLDNMVLAISLTPVLLDVHDKNSNLNVGLLVWALIIGTNLGGGLSPIGAPSGVLGLSILYKETGKKIGWIEFFRTVGLVTLVRILISVIYLIILGILFDSSSLIGI